jgi:hypothetical protein
MKYITSAYPTEFSINGLLIPQKVYDEYDVSAGKRAVLALADGEYAAKLESNAFFQRGVACGKFRVSDEPPLDAATHRTQEDAATIAALKAQISALEAELVALRTSKGGKKK